MEPPVASANAYITEDRLGQQHTTGIIVLSKALELNAHQERVKGLYDQLSAKDGQWASIPDGHIVRSTFAQQLDRTKDITLYARPADAGNGAEISVSPVYRDDTGKQIEGAAVTTFPLIDHEDTYKILLTDLQVPTDTFDLKISGDVDVDYVVDPAGMLVKVGSFVKPASTTGNQAVTGVGFQPKLVMFFGNNLTADGLATGMMEYFGAAVSSTRRAAIVEAAGDGVTNNGSKEFSGALVIANITPNAASPTVIASADFVSMDANGFTINWKICDATQRIVNYIAVAGDDLTNVDVGSFTAPTGVGDKAVTGVGFQPDALIFFDNAVTTTPVSPGRSTNPSFNMGFVVGTTKQGNRTATHATATNGSWGYQLTNAVLNSVDKTGAVVRTATIKTMDVDGFTLNFSVAPANAVYYNYIAFKGGQYDTGSFSQSTTTGNQSVTTGFRPAGVLLQSANFATSASTATTAKVSFGAAVSATERASMWTGESAAASPATDANLDRTKVLKMWTEGTPTLNTAMDFVSNDEDGFTVNNTTTDATSREVLYFAFGGVTLIPNSRNPALLVNTEAFDVIDDADTASDVSLQFGQTLDKNLTYNRTLTQFQFDDDLVVAGSITATGSIIASGSLIVEGAAFIHGTLSGNLITSATLQNVAINGSTNSLSNIGTGSMALHTKQIAVTMNDFTAEMDGTSNSANIFFESETSANPHQYYIVKTSSGQLQDLTLKTKVRVPRDFVDFGASNDLSFWYKNTGTGVADSKIDILVEDKDGDDAYTAAEGQGLFNASWTEYTNEFDGGSFNPAVDEFLYITVKGYTRFNSVSLSPSIGEIVLTYRAR